MILFERNKSNMDVYNFDVDEENMIDLKTRYLKDIKSVNIQICDWDRLAEFSDGYLDLYVGKKTSDEYRDVMITETDDVDLKQLYFDSLIYLRKMVHIHYSVNTNRSINLPTDYVYLYNGVINSDGYFNKTSDGIYLSGDLAMAELINRGSFEDLSRAINNDSISFQLLNRCILKKKFSIDYDHFLFCLNNGLLYSSRSVEENIEQSEKVLKKIRNI